MDLAQYLITERNFVIIGAGPSVSAILVTVIKIHKFRGLN